jgi:uncharacterized protein
VSRPGITEAILPDVRVQPTGLFDLAIALPQDSQVGGAGPGVMLGDMTKPSEESQGPLLSVRSEVERIVDPDSAMLQGEISIARDTKEEALRAAAVALDSLKNDLQDLGGVAKSASTHVQPLTWSTQRIITMPEYDNSLHSNTGRTVANVTVHLSLRDFSLLERIEEMFADQNHFRIIHTSWSVDNDNASWRSLRNEAIEEALGKGMDYAAALGSTVVSVEHVADVGLLGGSDSEARRRVSVSAMAASGGGFSVPSLDPVPQKIFAGIEARFRITTVPLPSSS